jgi:hypothetical protein
MHRDRGAVAVVMGGTAFVTVIVVLLMGLVAPADHDMPNPDRTTTTEPCATTNSSSTTIPNSLTTTGPCMTTNPSSTATTEPG